MQGKIKDHHGLGAQSDKLFNRFKYLMHLIAGLWLIVFCISILIDEDSALPREKTSEIAKTCKHLFLRLFKARDPTVDVLKVDENSSAYSESESEPPSKWQLKESELEMLISSESTPGKITRLPRPKVDVLRDLKLQMTVFETTGNRPASLEEST